MARVTRSTTVSLDGVSITVGELRDILAPIDPEAKITFHFSSAGGDPRERDTIQFTVDR